MQNYSCWLEFLHALVDSFLVLISWSITGLGLDVILNHYRLRQRFSHSLQSNVSVPSKVLSSWNLGSFALFPIARCYYESCLVALALWLQACSDRTQASQQETVYHCSLFLSLRETPENRTQCRVTRLRINVPVWSWETAMMYAAAVVGWGNQWLLNQSDTVALERSQGGTGMSRLWASLPPQGDFSQELLCPDILVAFFQFWKRSLNYAQSSPYWSTPPLSPTHHKKEEQKFLFLCEKPWAWCGFSSSCALAVCRPYSGTDSAKGPYVHWNRWSGRCWSKLSYVI